MAALDSRNHYNHLIFRIVEYGLRQEYFTINQLAKDLNLRGDSNEVKYLTNTLVSRSNASDNINHLIVRVRIVQGEKEDDWIYTLLPNAIIQYVDYLEITEARKMANDANRNSAAALSIAVVSILIGIVFGLWQFLPPWSTLI